MNAGEYGYPEAGPTRRLRRTAVLVRVVAFALLGVLVAFAAGAVAGIR